MWDSCPDGCNDELANSHAASTDHEKASTTKRLDEEHPRDCRYHVDNVGNKLDGERRMDTDVLEECSSIIEYKVAPGKLLEHLESATGENPTT